LKKIVIYDKYYKLLLNNYIEKLKNYITNIHVLHFCEKKVSYSVT